MFSLLLVLSSCTKEEVSEMDDVIVNEPTPEVVTTNPLISQITLRSDSDELDLGCFLVHLPFDLIVNGVTVTIEDSEDFQGVLQEMPETIDFVYPIEITNEDGTTESIADGVALGEIFANCVPNTGWGEDLFPTYLISDESSCYDMVYPVNLVDIDGNSVVANDEAEFIDLISQGDPLFFEFPLSLIDEDGDTVLAANDEELFTLLFDCEEIEVPGGDPIGDCWDFSYPFEMINQDGDIIVINNHDDYCNAMLEGLALELVYPLTLVNSDGEELVVNNEDELSQAWLDCFPPIQEFAISGFLASSNLINSESCYSIIYPFEYLDNTTGIIGVLEDASAAQAYIDSNNPDSWDDVLIFPVTVTEIPSGDEITFNSILEYFDFMANCQ